MWCL
jgi:tubulin monoglycylase TTLL3/8